MRKCENAFKEITNVSYKKIRREMYTYAAIFVCVITANVAAQMVFIPGAYNFKLSIYCAIFAAPILVNSSICLFALLHILEIKNGFSVLNKFLKHLRLKTRCSWFETALKQKSWKSNIEMLARIGTLHLELKNCIRQFNDVFGVLLAGKFITSFVTILTGVYFAHVNYLVSRHAQVFCCALSASSFGASLTVLCHKCSSTINEVNKCMFYI